MNNTNDFINSDDLAFFGKVNASISHELKNVMAIISEAAGLLQDLTEMAAKGQKIELEMLKSCSQDIVEEIQRGFAVVKQMNTFSHSVDEPVKEVNLVQVVELMTALSRFLSFASEIRFDTMPEEGPLILTYPFRLQNLIYQALVFAFKSVGPEGRIGISIKPQPDESVCLTFSGIGDSHAGTFASEKTEIIASSIGVTIYEKPDLQSLEMVLPKSVETTA